MFLQYFICETIFGFKITHPSYNIISFDLERFGHIKYLKQHIENLRIFLHMNYT